MSHSEPRYDLIVVRFGEVFLKGRNRPAFLDRLRSNVARAASGTGWEVDAVHGRFFLRPQPGAEARLERVLERVCRVPGVASVSPAREVDVEVETIAPVAAALAAATVPPTASTFAVRPRRSNKQLPYTSVELGRRVGDAVNDRIGLGVDLGTPDFEVGVEVGALSFVWSETRPGPGGLPVGTSGKVALLLSGGIDSPVAGYLAMQRGCTLIPVYFHSFPLIGDAARDKVLDIARVLARTGGPMRVHVVPFTDAQLAVRDAVHPRLYVLLYRRLMFRIAARIARCGAGALVTGESLGQVASQTLENLDCIGSVVDVPILRPLIGLDKQETVARAQRIGTYELSILPYDDCCSLFVPKHPETRGRRLVVERAERTLDMDALVAAALEGTEVEKVRPE